MLNKIQGSISAKKQDASLLEFYLLSGEIIYFAVARITATDNEKKNAQKPPRENIQLKTSSKIIQNIKTTTRPQSVKTYKKYMFISKRKV